MQTDKKNDQLGPEEKLFSGVLLLNAKVVGAIDCDGYRIERVIYESRPMHHVAANLYLPTKGRPPFPGVLVPCGHSDNGKAAGVYQSVSILLARNGVVALIFDRAARANDSNAAIPRATAPPPTRCWASAACWWV